MLIGMREVEMIFNADLDFAGINAISLVSEPAINEAFIALSANPIELKKIDEEKRLLLGAVLVPDMRILRKDKDGEHFNIFFKSETIREAAEMYMKQKRQDKSTIEHLSAVEGVNVVETWIVENSEKDKTAAYGLSYPPGTWVITMKVDNDEVWTNYVQTGKVTGYSIEGVFGRKEDKDESLLSAIKDLLTQCQEA